MNELKFIATIAERDIDFVLVEELSVNEEFCDWFTSRLFRKPIFKSTIGAWHSVNDAQLGETDVQYLFTSEDDGRIAVLIENKVDAVAQPTQADRYKQRGEVGKLAKKWDDFITCLVAPSKYLTPENQSVLYDVQLSYEELMSFFVSRRNRDRRFLFKAQLIGEAIEKNRRGYEPQVSLAMTQFVKEYCEFALAISPTCGVQEANPRPAGSTWVMFKPSGLAKGVSVAHQLTRGFVKLLIAGAAVDSDAVRERFSPHLPEGVFFEIAGKSVSLSIAVPPVDPLARSFKQEEKNVSKALEAIDQVRLIYRKVMG